MADERYEIDLERETGLVSAGTHNFRIAGCKESMGGSGYPNWAFDCICQDAGPDQGMHVRMNVSHSPQAAWKRNEFLDALGAPRKGKATSEYFIGKTFRGVITHETYKDQLQSIVDKCIVTDSPSPSIGASAPSASTDRPRVSIPTDVVKPKNIPF